MGSCMVEGGRGRKEYREIRLHNLMLFMLMSWVQSEVQEVPIALEAIVICP